MKERRVLHVVLSLNYGGVESRMRTIALNCSQSKYEHLFCALSSGGAVANELFSNGTDLTILNTPSSIPSLLAVRALVERIRAVRPDILHCHGAEANFHGLIAGKICGVTVCIAEEIGIPKHSNKARYVFRHLYKFADSIIAVSKPVKNALVENGEVEDSRCEVLLNPFNMLSPRGDRGLDSQFEIGFVGRLESIKNPIGLVRATAILRDRGIFVRVKFVGDGTQRQNLEHLVSELKLSGIVHFLGFEPRPFEKLQGISLYVLPSISEGLSNSLVEAMSAEIPVLATAVGGTPDVVKDGENGWLLQGTQPEIIAKGIEKCVSLGVGRLNEIGKRGRATVVERFSPAKYFFNCDALYDRLISKREA